MDFAKHVEKDFEMLFEKCSEEFKNLINSGEKLKKLCKKLFSNYTSVLQGKGYNTDNLWIRENWNAMLDVGYILRDINKDDFKNGKLKIDGDEKNLIDFEDCVICGFNKDFDGEKLRELLRRPSESWNISRRGIVSKEMADFLNISDLQEKLRVKKDNKNWGEESYKEKVNKIDKALNEKFTNLQEKLKEFQEDIQEGYKEWVGKGGNNKMASLIAHMIYPQFFPVFYKSTSDGYSQLEGLQKLFIRFLRALECPENVEEVGKFLNLYNYEKYARVYRVLLYLTLRYLGFEKKPLPHFDFFTQFLADLSASLNPLSALKRQKTLIIYGVPGTGKTHLALELAKTVCADEGGDRLEFVQFHPTYQYQDFMIGIKPKVVGERVVYSVVPGVFYRLCARAANDDESNKYVLVIDEINRADMSSVFGELLYAIEYRKKGRKTHLSIVKESGFSKEELGVEDPFQGGEKFFVPENLYIMGTMNQADRSLSGIDMAMRRRFAWYKSDFSRAELETMIVDNGGEGLKNLSNYIKRAEDLNRFIRLTPEEREKNEKVRKIQGKGNMKLFAMPLNEDHQIGHTYFAQIVDFLRPATEILPEHLEGLWIYHLQPLLEDFLGVDAHEFNDQLDILRAWFCKGLNDD